jgi:hypothetical protein
MINLRQLDEKLQDIESKNALLEIKAKQITRDLRDLKVSYASWINDLEGEKRAFIASLKS